MYTCVCFCKERDGELERCWSSSHSHSSLVANHCQVAPTQQLQNCYLQKCTHPPPVSCTVNKFALVLAGELLGIIEKNHCFLWLSFFSFGFTLKNVYNQMLFRSSLLSSLRWFPTLVVLGKLFFFLLLSFLNLFPFKLYCYYTNGFVSSYGEGLCQKINTTGFVEITYYNYYTQIISLDSDCR